MTDYLERLLEEQERAEDRRESGGDFPKLADSAFLTGRSRKTEGAGETGGEAGGRTMAPASGEMLTGETPAGGRTPHPAGETEPGSVDGADSADGGSGWAFTAAFSRTESAGDRLGAAAPAAGTGGAEALYRQLVRTGAAAKRLGQAGSGGTPRTGGDTAPAVWSAEGPGGAGTSYGPEELDRAFQRDARRYDGGFPLY